MFILLCLCVCLSHLQITTAQIHIPLNGTYSVSISTAKLTDDSRIDPLSSGNDTRSLMTSLFYPIPKQSCSKHCSVPYMPLLTGAAFDQFMGVPNGSVARFQMDVCCETKPSYNPDPSKMPLVIFSHGLGASRLIHNAQIQAVAASGYAVLSIDHTWDAQIVEFPDEAPIIGNFLEKSFTTLPNGTAIPNLDVLDFGAHLRAADATFALNQLGEQAIVSRLLPAANSTFNTSRVAMFGQSYGGATSILALTTEPRFLGGLNLDGNLYGKSNSTTTKPAVIVGTDTHNSTVEPSWAEESPKLQGFRREFAIQKIGHYASIDMPLLLEVGNLTVPPEVAILLGDLGVKRGAYVFNVVVSVVEAFLEFVFYGKKSALLENPQSVFPEVLEVK
jgi:dienelactone hydrolase